MMCIGLRQVEYAEIPVVDFAPLKRSGVSLEEKTKIRQSLAAQIRDIMTSCGFFYIVGHGYTEEQVRTNNVLIHRLFNQPGTERF